MRASVVVARGFSSCGSWALEHGLHSCDAWLLLGMWCLPRSGIEPVSPALAGGFFTTEPPGMVLVVLFLVFKGTSIVFFIVALPIYIPTNSVGEFLFSTTFPAFIVCRFFNDGHSDWREVIPHCSFDLRFSNN